MTYASVGDIYTYSGFEGVNFMADGYKMGDDEWREFLEDAILPSVDAFINRYCNVTTFELHEVVELKYGKGHTDDELHSVHLTPRDEDRQYLLKEHPVHEVTKVEIDINGMTSVPEWVELSERSDDTPGSYIVVSNFDYKYLYFIRDLPLRGHNMLRVTYTAGYPEGSQELDAIRLAATRVAINLLLYKKKVQEATTIRAFATRDYAQMFTIQNEAYFLTEEVKLILNRYRRPTRNPWAYE